MDPIVAALIAALSTGGVVKLIERVFSRPKEQHDIAAAIRDELRTELSVERERREAAEAAEETWRLRYFEEATKVAELNTQLVELRGHIKTLQTQVADLRGAQ